MEPNVALWSELEDVCTPAFQKLRRVIVHMTPNIEQFRDVDKALAAVIETYRKSPSSVYRLMARALMFLKQHTNMLRHHVNYQGLREQHCSHALSSCSDLLQAYYELQMQEAWTIVCEWGVAYRAICREQGVQLYESELPIHRVGMGWSPNPVAGAQAWVPPPALPVKEKATPLPPVIPQAGPDVYPPTGMTVAWYKQMGWKRFLNGHELIFLTGKYANQRCTIERWNSNNVRCRFLQPDGTEVLHCITFSHTVAWIAS